MNIDINQLELLFKKLKEHSVSSFSANGISVQFFDSQNTSAVGQLTSKEFSKMLSDAIPSDDELRYAAAEAEL